MANRNNIDFSAIINSGLGNGLTILETVTLAGVIGLFKDLSIEYSCLKKQMTTLVDMGLLKNEGEKIEPTKLGLKVFKIVKKRNTEPLAKTLRELYPPGMKDDRWPWRGTISSIADRLNEFFKMYPDINDDEVIEATKAYLKRYENNELGRSLLMYFIWKEKEHGGPKISILADFVYAMRETGNKPKTTTIEL